MGCLSSSTVKQENEANESEEILQQETTHETMPIEHPAMWVCSTCTFAENSLSSPLCTVCGSLPSIDSKKKEALSVSDHHKNKAREPKPERSSPMAVALSQLNKKTDFMDKKSRKVRKKSYVIFIDVYLTQIKRSSDAFGYWDVPKEIVALCISYFESADGSLNVRPNAFIQLDANYQYVFEEIVIGGSSTLSAKQNDAGKAKMTILCFGDIILHPYAYIHLNEKLKLSSYVGYAIYIESFGTIKMMVNSHIDIDSDNASILIKCNKLIMDNNSTIHAKNGNIVLVISDDKNRNLLIHKIMNGIKTGIVPQPKIHAESPAEALGNIQT